MFHLQVRLGEKLRGAFGEHAKAVQTGATLGDRLSMAFSERFFFHRTEKIVVIGVDDPLLPRELIDHAFALLDSCEYVVGPAALASLPTEASARARSTSIRPACRSTCAGSQCRT